MLYAVINEACHTAGVAVMFGMGNCDVPIFVTGLQRLHREFARALSAVHVPAELTDPLPAGWDLSFGYWPHARTFAKFELSYPEDAPCPTCEIRLEALGVRPGELAAAVRWSAVRVTNYLGNLEYRILVLLGLDKAVAPLVQLGTDALTAMRFEIAQLIDFCVAVFTVRRSREAFWGVSIKFHALHTSWTHHVLAKFSASVQLVEAKTLARKLELALDDLIHHEFDVRF